MVLLIDSFQTLHKNRLYNEKSLHNPLIYSVVYITLLTMKSDIIHIKLESVYPTTGCFSPFQQPDFTHALTLSRSYIYTVLLLYLQ
jgi:hypothetical protein